MANCWWLRGLSDAGSKSSDPLPGQRRASLWLSPLLALLPFLLIVALTGGAVYLSARSAVRQHTHDNLESVARLKVGQIEHWLASLSSNVRQSFDGPLFTESLQQWLQQGGRDGRLQDNLLEHLRSVAASHHYTRISIRSAIDGSLLLSYPKYPDKAEARERAMQAVRSRQPYLDDSHFAGVGPDSFLKFAYPVTRDASGQILAVAVVQVDPDDQLVPFLSQWPGASASSETLLAKTGGDRILYLSPLRHVRNLPSPPVDHPNVLMAQALRGKTGALVGVDYRDEPVLGYALPVAGTGWMSITKVDAREVFAELNQLTALVAAMVGVLFYMAWWWMVERGRYLELRYRRAMERRLMARRLDFLAKYANDCIVLTDLDGRIIEVNDQTLATYGYSRDEILGLTMAQLYAPDPGADLAGKQQILQDQGGVCYEARHDRKGGEVFPVEINCRRIDIDGQQYYQAIVRDITERKRMESALQESEERFHQAFDHAPIANAIVGMDGRLLAVNGAACRLSGYDESELLGRYFRELAYPANDENHDDWLEWILEQGDQPGAIERQCLHKDGRVLDLLVNLRLVRGVDGKPLYAMFQAQDITERKRSAQRIQQLSQLRSAISLTNQAIIRSCSPAEVYRAVCHACVKHGGLSLVWVGIAEPDEGRIVPVEVAGPAAGYLDQVVIRTDPGLGEGQGPTAIAFREQRVYISNDLGSYQPHVPWQQRAAAYGLSSMIALPLLREGVSYGTLSAYGPDPNFFDADAVDMLIGMADNISFAIDQFERDEQRRQAEERLRQSEENFRTLVESLPQQIVVKDAQSVYVSCNRLFAESVGVGQDRIAGLRDQDFYPPDLAEKYRSDEEYVLQNGSLLEFEESRNRGGEERILHVLKAPVRNGDGRIVGVLEVLRDVTEQKRVEQALTQYALEVDDLYQNAPCGYHSVDAEGNLIRINNTELQWLGYRRDELVGRVQVTDILSEASRKTFHGYFEDFKRTGVLSNMEMELLCKDGSILPVVINSTASYDAAGNFVASRTTVLDVTERRRQEAEQAEQAERFERLSRRVVAIQEDERRRLARELHDQVNPNLAAMKLLLGTLADACASLLPEESEACLEDTRALLDDTTAGIREICANLRPTLLDYAGLVPTLEGYAHMFGKRTGLSVRVSKPESEIRLELDVESMLFRIAQEALTNCAKHACAKHVDIELADGENLITFTIRDDGFGFDPELLGKSGHAPGLGMITMRERAEFVGGRFFVDSHPMVGTEIRVELDKVSEARYWQHPTAPGGERRARPRF